MQADGKAARKIGTYVHETSDGVGKHDHVVIETDAPARILFNDHRRFGLMDLVETSALEDDKLFRDIGIEPLSPGFNVKHMTVALDGKMIDVPVVRRAEKLLARAAAIAARASTR